ncbi:flagellar hook assembly protein FlgD [uncultured Sphingomonas sp.]|uniref:flagellar hook assembly protein FlgD n=1 Tax=uncultured Sphingomonas sp. TaxID=158754 RepID=UPI0025F691BE|nr:flagellar hook assembly protein FlgD [uncultured Sphingomonas sp.]
MATTTSAFDAALNKAGISTAATAKAAAAAKSSNSKTLNEMGPGDFIALLTAQMKNQDPFEPVDNSQMVAQMAQFSSLAGISEMGSTLKSISGKLSGGAADAAAYVGKTVLTPGKTAYTRQSGGFAGAVELGAAASDVKVTIKNSDGTTVRTLNLGKQEAGTASYDWDGKWEDGTDAGAGAYTVTVAASDKGSAVIANPLVWAPVTSVSMLQGGDPVLDVGGVGKIPTSAVRAIA